MGIIPQGISELSESILSYLITALTILAFVKIIQLVSNMGGIGELFKGGTRPSKPDNKPGASGGTGGSNGGKPGKEKLTPEQKAAARTINQQFDPNTPGFIKFLVVDEDDNPIKGATITVKPRYSGKNRYAIIPPIKGIKRTLNNNYRKYLFHTNADGYAPSRGDFERVGSGAVEISVTHPKYRMPKKRFSPTFQIKEDEKRMIIITMKGEGITEERINPYVHDINGNTSKLVLKGEIK